MEFKEPKEKLLKVFEETDRQAEEQEAYTQELRQRLYLAEKVCFEAKGFLKSDCFEISRLYLERLEGAIKKWDSGRQNNCAKYVVSAYQEVEE